MTTLPTILAIPELHMRIKQQSRLRLANVYIREVSKSILQSDRLAHKGILKPPLPGDPNPSNLTPSLFPVVTACRSPTSFLWNINVFLPHQEPWAGPSALRFLPHDLTIKPTCRSHPDCSRFYELKPIIYASMVSIKVSSGVHTMDK